VHYHLLFTFCTVMFFLLDFVNKKGAMDFGSRPLIQLECHKLALSPFPIVTIVDELKRSRSVLSQGISKLAQGLSGDPFCQSHRNLKALANRSRSRMPKPPRSLGEEIVG
jgi:hypothetical protein